MREAKEYGAEPPESLRAAIYADLKPVTPVAPSYRRAILLVPWTLIALAIFWSRFGFRPDMPVLGFVLAWGLSAAQLLLALWVAVGAIRGTIPGDGLPNSILWTGAFGAFGLHLAGLALAFRQSPFPAPPAKVTAELHACFYYELLIATPLLVIGVWLLARGFAFRPAIGGALAGLAAGLLADSTWRLICPFSFPSHVLPAHTGPILTMSILGAGLGLAVERLRRGGNRRI